MPLPPQLQTTRFRNALIQRELIICVGPLISQAAGFPSLGDLVHACLDACEEANLPIDRGEVEQFVDQGKIARAFEGIENVLGTLFRQVIADGLTCDFSKRPLAKTCLALEKLAPALFQVATTNLDRQLEVALRPAGWWRVKPSSNIAQQTRVLVPLHGEVAEHATWVLSPRLPPPPTNPPHRPQRQPPSHRLRRPRHAH